MTTKLRGLHELRGLQMRRRLFGAPDRIGSQHSVLDGEAPLAKFYHGCSMAIGFHGIINGIRQSRSATNTEV
jgi:hypothetical protein